MAAGGFNLGDIFVTLKASTEQFDRALKGAGEKVKGLEKVGSQMTSAGNAIIGFATKGALALGAATTAALGFALNSAAAYEQNRIAFETMLGSAEKARILLKQLSDFAVKTPFNLPDIVEGSKRLLAYGLAAEDVIPTMTALGNISAGVGRDKLPFLITALGQVRAKTVLSGEELKQFTETGVPLIEELSKVTGISVGEIVNNTKDLGISYDSVLKALTNMSSEGGKFYNLMDRQSKTLSGTISNLQDDMGRMAREIVGLTDTGDIVKDGLFDKVSHAAMDLLTWIDANKEAIVKFATEAIATAIEWGTKFVNVIISIVDWMQKHQDIVIAAAIGIGILAIALASIAIAAAAAEIAITTLISIAIAAVGGLVTYIVIHWEDIKRYTVDLWNSIKSTFSNGVNAVITFFRSLPEQIAYWLGFLSGRFARFLIFDVPNFINGIIQWFFQLPGRIPSILQNVIDKLSTFGSRAYSIAQNAGGNIYNGFINSVIDLPNKMFSIFWNVVSQITTFGSTLYNKAKSLADSFWKGFKEGLGIHSPSYIEKAFMNIEQQGYATVDAMKENINNLNGIAGSLPTMTPTLINSQQPQAQFSTSQKASQATVNIYNPVVDSDSRVSNLKDEIIRSINRAADLSRLGQVAE